MTFITETITATNRLHLITNLKYMSSGIPYTTVG